MKRLCLAVALALLMLFSGQVYPAPDDGDTVRKIQFEGNEVTDESVLLQEVTVKPGEIMDPDVIERSRQNIMDLGLFRSVQAKSTYSPEGAEVTFVVDEKRFWYLVPVFSRGSDGDLTFGVRLQIDNLLGKNSYLTVRAKRKDFEDTDTQSEETLEVEYLYPRIFGTKYDLGFQFDYDQSDIEEQRENLSGDYFREKTTLGLTLSKWLTNEGPSKGFRLSVGIRTDKFDHEFLGGDPNLFTNLTINSLLTGIEYIDVVDHGNFRSGVHYGAEIEMTNKYLGSDVTHATQNLFYRRYKPLNKEKISNLNLQVKFGSISRSVFGDATYQIASGATVRGYQRDSIEGNTFYLANIEYLRRIANKETLRGAAFLDIGDAFRNIGDLDLTDPKVGVGLGLRWKVRSFVRTDLRVDVAHGLGANGETRVYAGTRATF